MFSTYPGSREDRAVAELRAKHRAYLRSVLAALGCREPAGDEPGGTVIECVVVLTPVAVRYYPVPATGRGPAGMQFTAAKARGLVSVRTGDRCEVARGIEQETRPPQSISSTDDLSVTSRYEVTLDYWTWEAVKRLLEMIRPTQQQIAALVRSCVPWDRELAERVITDHLSDQALLAVLARTHENHVIRGVAARKLVDQTVLAEIARSDADEYVRGATTGGSTIRTCFR